MGMKVGAKAMSQGALAQALSESTDLKKAVCAKAVKSLAETGTQQVKSAGKFVLPGFVHDQDALEAGDKGWQEGSVRKGCHGQSQASEDCGEGVPRLGIEESFLSSCSMCQSPVCCPWKKHAECASGVVLGSSCALSLYIMRSRE